ncbi:MAG: hypothetical protein UR26_C0003G0022 [candidate division TM6 bacterium GW2011_GWF2_32_72]|nr:MAG: hypothetical protein UR26_C0003G0022 [candidate division TM6 bacterium GW2011_GWF2_32_72]
MQDQKKFTGNLYIFHAFDVGYDIDLKGLQQKNIVEQRPLVLSRFFKNYHVPIAIDLPRPNTSKKCIGARIHAFGVISLVYKIPFNESLATLREKINDIDKYYQEQSVDDAGLVFGTIKQFISKPKFFHIRSSYPLIQVNPEPNIDPKSLKEEYGGTIASTIRFETHALAEYQKDEILESNIGYYKGDLVLIDTEAAFAYDKEYEDILDLFEFANIESLELQYFDQLLDKKLNEVYERKIKHSPIYSYIPFIGPKGHGEIMELENLRVDVSVISERLESSIKFVGEAYYAEVYDLLAEKFDFAKWKMSINSKLEIIKEIRTLYQEQININKDDLLSILIIILIFIELVVAILSYLK